MALPTVRKTNGTTEYANSLRELAKKLEADSTINISYHTQRDEFCSDLYWLADKGDEYGTIDTYAKFCFDNGIKDLAKIKFTLSLYFTIKQHIEKCYDNRYRNFLIKLYDRKNLFPENIKILNWNYDFQMQLAAELYKKEEFNYSTSVSRHAPPLISYYPGLGNEFNLNHEQSKNEFSMIHLNGIAGFYFYEQTAHILNYHLNQSLQNVNQLFEKAQLDKEYKYPLLTFAYENNNGVNYYLRNRLKFAHEIIKGTDILVIIGYSFPDDNVTIDKSILDVLVSTGLKKVIFQNPTNSGDFLIDEFGLKNVTLRHENDCSEFHIPRELKMNK